MADQIKGQQNKAKVNSKKDSNHAIHSKNSSDSHENESNGNAEYRVEIFVPALAARHIPLFLDYVYGSSLKLTTQQAMPLRYLSNRFDCRDLHKEVTMRFIAQDLELNTAPQYCTMAGEMILNYRIMLSRFS